MLARVNGSALVGTQSYTVQVEVDVTNGLPAFEIVGLPDAGVRESRVRVKSAIRNSTYEFPNRRIHVNMAPADLKKEGPSFDLPLALAILEATEQVRTANGHSFIAAGELSLNGEVREIPGALSIALGARERGARFILVPNGNTAEAALVKGLDVYGVASLREAARFLQGDLSLVPAPRRYDEPPAGKYSGPDLSEVRGQESARRALEVAAAGGHNLLMAGPPGSGKTMLARRLAGILPALTLEEAMEVTRIHSVAGLLTPGASLLTDRPFRAPHNSITAVGLIGGGVPLPKPGEVSLGHAGVLYMDELPLFPRNALESLRGPLEERKVTIVRSMVPVTYPAGFSLVASMNPCPCGYLGDPQRECVCSVGDIQRYRARISGPLLDRIDIQVEVPRLTREQIQRKQKGEATESVRSRVTAARKRQLERLEGTGINCNADMSHAQLEKQCALAPEPEKFLGMAVERLGLSARSYNRALKVARTIADLGGRDAIEVADLAEAIQYRCLERAPFA